MNYNMIIDSINIYIYEYFSHRESAVYFSCTNLCANEIPYPKTKSAKDDQILAK